MNKKRILVVDDEARMRKLVKDFLVKNNMDVVEAADGEEAITIFFQEKNFDLVILDVMMPKMDGWEVLKTIREYSQVPVIMLTAKGEEQDEMQGFAAGADDYVTKPFSPKLLVARIEAILRRNSSATSEVMHAGKIELDKSAHSVRVDGKEIDLSYKEFELLAYFIENQGIALSREKILNHVWNYDYFGDARTIDTHVKKLRSKLGDCQNYIHTIWGMGYKFEVEEQEA
ncbi:MAG: response regulator transcription factor [Lachnospiraceae bacterium]|nr:response regulator transcription factor [Cuneatibacter sp.]MDD6456794.1 response regulator transcription factor [Lachnospiraceae bacterium]